MAAEQHRLIDNDITATFDNVAVIAGAAGWAARWATADDFIKLLLVCAPAATFPTASSNAAPSQLRGFGRRAMQR